MDEKTKIYSPSLGQIKKVCPEPAFLPLPYLCILIYHWSGQNLVGLEKGWYLWWKVKGKKLNIWNIEESPFFLVNDKCWNIVLFDQLRVYVVARRNEMMHNESNPDYSENCLSNDKEEFLDDFHWSYRTFC